MYPASSMTRRVEVGVGSPVEVETSGPAALRLEPNHPNSFNARTNIGFSIASAGRALPESQIKRLVHRPARLFSDAYFLLYFPINSPWARICPAIAFSISALVAPGFRSRA